MRTTECTGDSTMHSDRTCSHKPLSHLRAMESSSSSLSPAFDAPVTARLSGAERLRLLAPFLSSPNSLDDDEDFPDCALCLQPAPRGFIRFPCPARCCVHSGCVTTDAFVQGSRGPLLRCMVCNLTLTSMADATSSGEPSPQEHEDEPSLRGLTRALSSLRPLSRRAPPSLQCFPAARANKE